MTGRVLIVDDDGATTQTFARMLTLEGYEVRTAPDAEQGLRESAAWDPDAIIVDLRMPFINGLGFLYRLRARQHSDTPTVIVTGDLCIEDAMISEIRALGADVRFKPLWLDELVALVQTLVAADSHHAHPSSASSSTAASVLP